MAAISVIIPVFNGQKTIARCLRSVFNQSFQSVEIVVVNDGSTDSTAEILKQFAGRIKIITQPNRGASAARNAGAKATTSPLIIFLDADIVMEKTMLETLEQALQTHREASYAYSSFKFGFKTFRLFAFDAKKLKTMPYIHTSALMRREHFPGFDESLKRFQDWDLWLTMLEAGHTGIFIDAVLFSVTSGGTMSSWLPSLMYRLPILKNTKKVRAYQQAKKIIVDKHNL